jgi:hypothetical protein
LCLWCLFAAIPTAGFRFKGTKSSVHTAAWHPHQPGDGQRLEAVKNTNYFRDEGGGELFILSHSDMAPR